MYVGQPEYRLKYSPWCRHRKSIKPSYIEWFNWWKKKDDPQLPANSICAPWIGGALLCLWAASRSVELLPLKLPSFFLSRLTPFIFALFRARSRSRAQVLIYYVTYNIYIHFLGGSGKIVLIWSCQEAANSNFYDELDLDVRSTWQGRVLIISCSFLSRFNLFPLDVPVSCQFPEFVRLESTRRSILS